VSDDEVVWDPLYGVSHPLDPKMINRYWPIFMLAMGLAYVYGAVCLDRCEVASPASWLPSLEPLPCSKGTPCCINPIHRGEVLE
jgi:hypothetical protein